MELVKFITVFTKSCHWNVPSAPSIKFIPSDHIPQIFNFMLFLKSTRKPLSSRCCNLFYMNIMVLQASLNVNIGSGVSYVGSVRLRQLYSGEISVSANNPSSTVHCTKKKVAVVYHHNFLKYIVAFYCTFYSVLSILLQSHVQHYIP
jgi:hypothetical protein